MMASPHATPFLCQDRHASLFWLTLFRTIEMNQSLLPTTCDSTLDLCTISHYNSLGQDERSEREEPASVRKGRCL